MRLLLCVFAVLFLVSCAHQNAASMQRANIDGGAALDSFVKSNPELKKIIKSSAGYVIYPHVGKGAVGVGGAYAKGEVYEKSGLTFELVGYSELTQVNVGLQLGGQTFGEIVFFETAEAFSQFKRGELEFSADASAVAIEKGKAIKASQFNGYLVVVLDQKGLMGELSIGGQKLSYMPRAQS